ncbi:hypothetical protein RDWZM_004489 [Blomia tropicalis]|uniref:Spaetzle domain-containing protein n=1 Tax=Blomia tropicalis TaxID=40697 RepID=A0A9Q0M487_BLOTA|nr:hypothetical protein BLOT_010640 [Blomia tropicalis]KAJ6218677.1 hypothetical protein RDWZM_004489 [Blomia tropicalis]
MLKFEWRSRSTQSRHVVWLTVVILCSLKLDTFHFCSKTTIPLPPLDAPNNVIKLIIKTYVNELLDSPGMDPDQLKRKMASMNDYISTHPALHQRYLWVGSTPPAEYNPDLHEITGYDQNTTRFVVKRKRNSGMSESKEQLPSEEICETKQKWEQINETHDLYDNKAKVIQQEDMKQFVFSYRCAKNKGKCLGISQLYESECTERFGWMYMYYKPENKPPQWGFVNAPHHCACRLKPKFYQPTISSADEPMK